MISKHSRLGLVFSGILLLGILGILAASHLFATSAFADCGCPPGEGFGCGNCYYCWNASCPCASCPYDPVHTPGSCDWVCDRWEYCVGGRPINCSCECSSLGSGACCNSWWVVCEEGCFEKETTPTPTPTNQIPVGWHDGNSGIQPQSGCLAYGWATDPDDKNIDLDIRILSDGVEVATRKADSYRSDLGGVCPGGTCAFTQSLWGLISRTSHSITVQAKDAQTGAWQNLSGTPKNIICDNPPAIGAIVPDSPVCSLGDENSKSKIITTYQDQDEGDGLLGNGSFENGATNWHFGPINRQVPSGGAKFGNNYLQVNKPCPTCPSELGPTDYSFFQDVSRTTNAGETYTWSTYVRSPTGAPVSGTLALWNMGSGWNDLVVNTPFTVSSTSWQQIKGTSGPLARGGNALRAQVYLGTGGNVNFDFDGARLVTGSDSGLWTDIQRAYFGLAPCGATGEAYCGNFEKNLANYFGAVYYPSTNSVRVAQNSYGASTCSGGAPSAECPWVTVSSFPVSNEDGTVKLTGVRSTIEGSNLRIEWDLVFDGLPLATYNLYGMVVDNAGVWQNPSGPQWDDKGDITLKECITDPWFQTQGGDVHGETGISSPVIEGEYFCKVADYTPGFPGVVSYGSGDYDFKAGTEKGEDRVSPDPFGWLANSSYTPGYDYDDFYKKLDSPTVDNFKDSNGRRYCDEVACPTPAGTTIYYVDGDLNIQRNSDWAVPNNSKIVVLINGNLNINFPAANRKITIAQGGFLGLIVNGNINIDGNIGDKQVAVTPYLEGVYLAVGDTSIIDTYEPDPADPGQGSGKRLVGAGLFYARGGFSLQRDLKDDCSVPSLVCNARNPAELFIFRPDLVLNAPSKLWVSKMSWLEVAP